MLKSKPLTEERLRTMKRRLRKKRYLGEFQEHAFELKIDFTQALNEAALMTFLEDFLEAVEARQLDYIGGIDSRWLEGTIMAAKRYSSPSEEDRHAINDWLKKRSEVANCTTGELFDAWYGED